MAGLYLSIPTVFTDTSAPILRDDPILPAAGALMLLEPAHPMSQWASGVPANGATVPNIVGKSAAALLGVAQSSTDGVIYNSPYSTSAMGKFERTTKGGLHVIMTTAATTANQGYQVRIPQAFFDYLKAHPENDIYASHWVRTTALPTTTAYQVSHFGTSSQFAFGLGPSPVGLPGNRITNWRGEASTAAIALGPVMRNNKIDGIHATMASSGTYSATSSPAFHNANVGYTSGGSTLGKAGSQVFYRFYMEDLTVSGRTYADVDALDLALYQAAVVNAGGRYYGDTYTDPTTIV